MPEYKYKLHGLVISSWIPLPDASLAGMEDAPDIQFIKGDVPSSLNFVADEGACWQSAPGQVLVWVDGVARFLIEQGKSVIVEPCPSCSPETMSNLFFDTPLASVLLQRGLICLNAVAIQKQEQSILILGPHGSGKSTLAVELVKRGFEFIADEVVVLGRGPDGNYRVRPGVPVIKLWGNSLRLLELNESSLAPLRLGVDKKKLPQSSYHSNESNPVKTLFLINEVAMDVFSLEEVELIRRLPILLEFVQCRFLLNGLGIQKSLFKELGILASKVEVVRILRSKNEFCLLPLTDAIERRALQ